MVPDGRIALRIVPASGSVGSTRFRPGGWPNLSERSDMDKAISGRGAHLVKLNRETPAARRYTFDEHYFDTIDTPDKAYWLGFIAGDGCINDGALVIVLAAKDEGHLRSFAAYLQATHPVRFYTATVKGKTYPNARLGLHSWRLVEALGRLGITPRKSAILEPWDGPGDLMPHYWRGLVDADGHIAAGPGWQIDLVGTESVVTAFGAWAKSVEPSIEARPVSHKAIWKFSVSGRVLARSVAQALYADAGTALPRKAERAAALIATGPRPPRVSGTVSVDADGSRHGTWGYRHRCRCGICRAAHADGARRSKAKKDAAAGTTREQRELLRRQHISEGHARKRARRALEVGGGDNGQLW